MDTTVKSTFNAHINDHIIVKFLKCGHRLNYFDTDKSNKSPVNTYSFLSTVKDNKSCFSRHEIKGADRAPDLYRRPAKISVQIGSSIRSFNFMSTKI